MPLFLKRLDKSQDTRHYFPKSGKIRPSLLAMHTYKHHHELRGQTCDVTFAHLFTNYDPNSSTEPFTTYTYLYTVQTSMVHVVGLCHCKKWKFCKKWKLLLIGDEAQVPCAFVIVNGSFCGSGLQLGEKNEQTFQASQVTQSPMIF